MEFLEMITIAEHQQNNSVAVEENVYKWQIFSNL